MVDWLIAQIKLQLVIECRATNNCQRPTIYPYALNQLFRCFAHEKICCYCFIIFWVDDAMQRPITV